MADYNSNLKTWGSTGSEYPTGYNYVEGEQPVDAWDNFFNHNAQRDISHLVSLTNKRLESSSGSSYPGSPEDGELCWRSDNSRLAVFDDDFDGWREVAFRSDVSDLRSDVGDFEDDFDSHVDDFNAHVAQFFGHVDDFDSHVDDFDGHVADYNDHVADFGEHVADFDDHAADESAHHERYSDDEARSAVDGASVTTAGNVDTQGDMMEGMLAVVSDDYQNHLSVHRDDLSWWIGPTQTDLGGGLQIEDGQNQLTVGVADRMFWNGNEVWHNGNQEPVERTALAMQFLSL